MLDQRECWIRENVGLEKYHIREDVGLERLSDTELSLQW